MVINEAILIDVLGSILLFDRCMYNDFAYYPLQTTLEQPVHFQSLLEVHENAAFKKLGSSSSYREIRHMEEIIWEINFERTHENPHPIRGTLNKC